MATFLVCHGAWSAGWAWKKMRPLLRNAGHEVFTPTYTGLGERVHQCFAAVHVEMVCRLIENQEVRSVECCQSQQQPRLLAAREICALGVGLVG